MTTQSFNLDLIPLGVSPSVHVSQYDKGQTWLISLFENNIPFNIPSGASVTVQGTNPTAPASSTLVHLAVTWLQRQKNSK